MALIWFSLRCRCLWLELAHADTRGHTHAPRDLRTNSTLSAYTQREFFCLFVCLFNQGRPPVFCFLFFGFFFSRILSCYSSGGDGIRIGFLDEASLLCMSYTRAALSRGKWGGWGGEGGGPGQGEGRRRCLERRSHAIYLQIVCSRGCKPEAWSWQESLIWMHPILGPMAHKRQVVAAVSI